MAEISRNHKPIFSIVDKSLSWSGADDSLGSGPVLRRRTTCPATRISSARGQVTETATAGHTKTTRRTSLTTFFDVGGGRLSFRVAWESKQSRGGTEDDSVGPVMPQSRSHNVQRNHPTKSDPYQLSRRITLGSVDLDDEAWSTLHRHPLLRSSSSPRPRSCRGRSRTLSREAAPRAASSRGCARRTAPHICKGLAENEYRIPRARSLIHCVGKSRCGLR